MSKDIFVVIEQRDGRILGVGLELLAKARELAAELGQSVCAVLLGSEVSKKAQTAIEHGADSVFYVEDAMLGEYATEPYAKALTHIIHAYEPEIVLFGATSVGRDLAPRVAARIHTGLTADCTGLAIDAESKLLHMTRPAFGGNLMATIVCSETRPQMATVRPGVFVAQEADASRSGEITRCDVAFTPDDMNIEILAVEANTKKSVDITQSHVLVSGGRGMGGADGYAMLAELASELGGEVSSSRAGVDAGWVEHERQVGQTGKTVRPNVYVACGISGALQHLAGMEESDCVIAINRDPSAPIMDMATLGIVGDLLQIVPKLTQAVRKRKAELAAQ